jgi:hypothetical protein
MIEEGNSGIDYYQIFDDLWEMDRREEAVQVYEFLKRPFWLAERIGLYYEHTYRPDRAMHEYQRLIDAYFDMGPNFLPLPGGPLELYKLGKWFLKTDPVKAQKYLKLYVLADERNPGEQRKVMFKSEAKQLLEELMENKHALIQKRIRELKHYPDITLLHEARTVPDAMSLASRAESRLGLWWYHPKSGKMFFSVTARGHLKLDEFSGMDEIWGGTRGAIFQKDELKYMLIYKCDLPLGALSGQILVDIYEKAQKLSGLIITGGILDEEGCDLLGVMNEVQ